MLKLRLLHGKWRSRQGETFKGSTGAAERGSDNVSVPLDNGRDGVRHVRVPRDT